MFAVVACGGSDGDTSSTEALDTTATTEVPATDPPATDPPATNPPATDPPATDPPATDPPATDPPATDPPATDPPPGTPIDAAFLAEQAAKSWDPQQPGGVLVMVFDADGESVSASVGAGTDGEPLSPDGAIRVGSITLPLTATTVLSLVDEGLVELDAPLSQYLTRVDLDDRITVRDALQFSSGLLGGANLFVSINNGSYSDPRGYLPMLLDDPSRAWTPDEVFDLVGSAPVEFDPGTNQAYSYTNYIALGLLIEEVTGQPYHQAVRERIIDPLAMSDTYLQFAEEGAEPDAGYTALNGEIEPVAFDLTSIVTNEWSAAGYVSTGRDLHRFMTALFAGDIISPESLSEMTQDPKFGIFEPQWPSDTPLLAQDGRTFGSGTFVVHAPETGMTVFTFANADHLKVSPATSGVAELIGARDVGLVSDG